MLSRHTLLTEFVRANEVRFQTVGWPGYVGALSGVAPGRFAVTLNAVLSDDPPGLAPPVTFLIRDVLDTALDYEEAIATLRDSPVTSDSLLLVTGTAQGEMAVVERGPSRAAVREPEGGFVVVTNDYRSLPSATDESSLGNLAETSCRRFDRASELVRATKPDTTDACHPILADDQVRMDITVQSMVLSARRGRVDVRLPCDARI